MTALHSIRNRTRPLPPLRVGVGGPVGSGKTTLVEMLCKTMRERYDLVVVTNDIYTKEDQRLLTVAGALDAGARQAFLPMLAILSAQHESQYSRLFRS